MLKVQEKLATFGGDVWSSRKMFAFWPWPPLIWGVSGFPGEKFTEDDYRFLTKILEPGDFVVTRSSGFIFSNNAIPGAFKHLMVYVGLVGGKKDYEKKIIQKPRLSPPFISAKNPDIHPDCVIHATSDGVICQDIMTPILHADYAGVIRVTENWREKEQIIAAAIERVGLPYNFDFTPRGPESNYCTELGFHCLQKAGLKTPKKSTVSVSLFGKKADVPLADDFVDAFGLYATTKSCEDSSFFRKARYDSVRKAVLESFDFENPEKDA